jgi:hypothetical protein
MSDIKVARLHDQPDGPRPLDLSMQELYKLLLKSEKFLNWKSSRFAQANDGPSDQKTLTPRSLNRSITPQVNWARCGVSLHKRYGICSTRSLDCSFAISEPAQESPKVRIQYSP